VDIQQVQVVRSESVEHRLDLVSEVFSAEAVGVRVTFACRPEDFGCDDELVAVATLEPLANPSLALATAVHVGRVDESPASILVRIEQFVCLLTVNLQVPCRRLTTEPPGPKGDFAYFQPGSSHRHCLEYVFHGRPIGWRR
jgi:hypothetical protein